MKLLSIVGHSGNDKTTLIEKLLPVLNAAGLKVATIKHTHHQMPLDMPGKDSWCFKQAERWRIVGYAASVVLLSAHMILKVAFHRA